MSELPPDAAPNPPPRQEQPVPPAWREPSPPWPEQREPLTPGQKVMKVMGWIAVAFGLAIVIGPLLLFGACLISLNR
jgi:hypothetical protein